ncbi:phosphonate C-P lyase system protein PhnH [Polycladidibacter stylochi]|uniref:phosphonate C-P lyase system protein PhnH n=1 Tax=Polycladidibacter stylochi TaxID=1807766 RepID=UPI000831602B|nr:phosphonate C-P lyase system protein PhnH [Pseudovibrio stylochi]
MTVSTLLKTAPKAGFENPVLEAQAVFRALMNAQAKPGTLQSLADIKLSPPAPLNKAATAIILCLCDYDTPIWLDDKLANSPEVASYIRFHCNAPITQHRHEAAFAFISEPEKLATLEGFAIGTGEYPDRSTTVVLCQKSLNHAQSVQLQGPGIQTSQSFAPSCVPAFFWRQIQENHQFYPLGIDVLFAADEQIAALPRSTKVIIEEQ